MCGCVCLLIFLYVLLVGTRNREDWRLQVKEGIAKLQKCDAFLFLEVLKIYLVLNFLLFFGSLVNFCQGLLPLWSYSL